MSDRKTTCAPGYCSGEMAMAEPGAPMDTDDAATEYLWAAEGNGAVVLFISGGHARVSGSDYAHDDLTLMAELGRPVALRIC